MQFNLVAESLTWQAKASTGDFHWDVTRLLLSTGCSCTYNSKEWRASINTNARDTGGKKKKTKYYLISIILELQILYGAYLVDISYRCGITVQGTLATVTDWRISWAFCPKLEPETVKVMPPSTNPDKGST